MEEKVTATAVREQFDALTAACVAFNAAYTRLGMMIAQLEAEQNAAALAAGENKVATFADPQPNAAEANDAAVQAAKDARVAADVAGDHGTITPIPASSPTHSYVIRAGKDKGRLARGLADIEYHINQAQEVTAYGADLSDETGETVRVIESFVGGVIPVRDEELDWPTVEHHVASDLARLQKEGWTVLDCAAEEFYTPTELPNNAAGSNVLVPKGFHVEGDSPETWAIVRDAEERGAGVTA